jgi:hypothetical protein
VGGRGSGNSKSWQIAGARGRLGNQLTGGGGKDAYAPSLPNSLVHSAFLVRSSPLTVGREALMALMKSRTRSGGSSSSSPVRSVQDFSCACASPGEQGVHFVSPSTSTCGGC